MVVVVALAAMQLMRALREFKRLKARVESYADLPVLKALERTEASVQRLGAVGEKIAPLVERAQAALAIIRRGPIPPELMAAARRVSTEIAALRAFASR